MPPGPFERRGGRRLKVFPVDAVVLARIGLVFGVGEFRCIAPVEMVARATPVMGEEDGGSVAAVAETSGQPEIMGTPQPPLSGGLLNPSPER